MATKEEVMAAIAAEKAEVDARLTELNDRVAAAEAKAASGEQVTPADWDAIKAAVQGIHNANATPVEPGTPLNPV